MMPRARGISWRAFAGAMILAFVVMAATAFPAAAIQRPRNLIHVETAMSLTIGTFAPMVARYSGAVRVAGIESARHPNGVSRNTKRRAKRKAKKFCKNYLREGINRTFPVPVLVFSGDTDPLLADNLRTGLLGVSRPPLLPVTPNKFDFLSAPLPGFVRGEVSLIGGRETIRIRGKKWKAICDSARFPPGDAGASRGSYQHDDSAPTTAQAI